MKGKLYGIGVGPGDPELLTIKALRLLRESDVIAAPGEDCHESMAYRIAVQAAPEIREKECVGVPMPMTRDAKVLERSHQAAAARVLSFLQEGKNVAFLNLGDVTIYASVLYIHRRVRNAGYESVLVNGVPSFCAAAARLGIGLAEGTDELHVFSQPERMEEGLRLPGTKVIMKMGKQLRKVKTLLEVSEQEVMMVERCGMPGERVFYSAEELDEQAGYYSVAIVKSAAAGKNEDIRGGG